MAMELNDLKQPDNNNEVDERSVEVCPGNGSCSNHNTPNATEDSRLLDDTQVAASNGECSVDMPDGSTGSSSDEGTLRRLKRELNETACWKLKVWMLILISLIIIILVIFFSIYFCTVHREDVDDKYDFDEFVVPRFFRGNFTLLNKTLTLAAQSQSRDVFLKQKLTDSYKSSNALGRYFCFATVNPLRNSNSSFEYKLKFVMPEEHKQIIQYTLSEEMVYHVLLQQLFDEDTGQPLYFEPTSFTMEVDSTSADDSLHTVQCRQ